MKDSEILFDIFEVNLITFNPKFLEHKQFKATLPILASEALELKQLHLSSHQESSYEKV